MDAVCTELVSGSETVTSVGMADCSGSCGDCVCCSVEVVEVLGELGDEGWAIPGVGGMIFSVRSASFINLLAL